MLTFTREGARTTVSPRVSFFASSTHCITHGSVGSTFHFFVPHCQCSQCISPSARTILGWGHESKCYLVRKYSYKCHNDEAWEVFFEHEKAKSFRHIKFCRIRNFRVPRSGGSHIPPLGLRAPLVSLLAVGLARWSLDKLFQVMTMLLLLFTP